MIRFNRYHVTDGILKTRVFYSLSNRADGRECVTLYARDYSNALGNLFAGHYKNETDSQTDYFDKGHVTLFESHPLYAAAKARAEAIRAQGRAR